MADIHNCQVHRDATDHRRVFAADNHAGAIRKQARITVRITYRQHRDSAECFRDDFDSAAGA